MMAYYCYILKCADGTFYTGWSTDPVQRLKQHNAGRGARYTRSRRPVELVFTEEHPTQTAAMRREIAIKRLPRAKKRALAESYPLVKTEVAQLKGRQMRK
jgi:putative endonuclease